jgi:hypothetical protein
MEFFFLQVETSHDPQSKGGEMARRFKKRSEEERYQKDKLKWNKIKAKVTLKVHSHHDLKHKINTKEPRIG